MLPKPPTDGEKYAYINQNKGLLYSWGLFSFIALIIGMALFTQISAITYAWAPIALLYLVYLGSSYLIGVFGKAWNQSRHEIRKNYWLSKEEEVPVDIYLPSCGEPLSVLKNTYFYTQAIRWRGNLNFYVLDDSGREEVKRLAEAHRFSYIARPNQGELKKAGNIRHAFLHSYGRYILILDADFAPRADILEELAPYMMDERCAIVQSPQYFDHAGSKDWSGSWVQAGAAYVQELFYRLIQVNRDTWKASICVGTCALYRRAALEPHGGTYPIAYSEDCWTGFQATIDGYYVKYIPLNLAKGLCPDSMSAFFVQQTRWCTGAVSLLLSQKFWSSPLPTMTRVCYLSGMLYYIATALSVVVGMWPGIIVVLFFPDKVHWYNYLWALPSFITGVVILNLWSKAKWGMFVLSTRQVSYYAHCFALWNKLRGSLLEWIPSGNDFETKRAKDYQRFKMALFFWTSITTCIALCGAFYRMDSVLNYNYYPIIFFSLLNYFVSIECLAREA